MTKPLSKQFASCMTRIRRAKKEREDISNDDSWKARIRYEHECSNLGLLSRKTKALKARRAEK